MLRRFVRPAIALLGVSLPIVIAADEPKPVEGSLEVGKGTYKLQHVVAYETKDDNDDDDGRISVIASDRRIPIDQIKKTLRENEGSDERLFLLQPYVRVVFRKTGEVESGNAWADNSSFSTNGDALTGKVQIENGRARGQAKLALPPSRDFKQNFQIRFDVALGLDGPPKAAAKPAAPVKPSVSGTFTGNGKPAKLAFVSARPGEPFNDKPSIVLVFTEKDHSKDPRPDIRASFGEFGSALVISLHEDGGIFGCQVTHAAHAKQGFSSLGNIRTPSFDVGEGRVEGQIQTDGEVNTFGEKWQVDLKFVAPYAAPAPKPQAGAAAGKGSGDNPQPGGSKGDSAKPAAAVNVRDLPFPKDATDIEYKELVEQITFTSATAVQALASDLSKKLASQGWKGDGADLITPQSSILNRTRGKATLTIMLKPSGKGSQATVFADGLEWGEK
ncbi:MAG: hypothetical protein ACT4QC_10555 [Planctomycetaceae bacterium]